MLREFPPVAVIETYYRVIVMVLMICILMILDPG